MFKLSRPIRACGLKQCINLRALSQLRVAPYTGVWIETVITRPQRVSYAVAPYTGVWIETHHHRSSSYLRAVAPYTGVWIETPSMFIIVIADKVAPYTGVWIETTGEYRPASARLGRALYGRVD